MDIAVLADIHSNYIALEHCMAYALEKGIKTFLFLGDYIGEMAYPEKTMELLYDYRQKYECHFIRGNKENYWLDYRANGEKGWLEHNSTTGALLYAYKRLSKKDLEFFQSLPIVKELSFEDLPPLTICHGSPTDVRGELIRNEALTKKVLENSPTDYILCGHTHIQGKYIFSENMTSSDRMNFQQKENSSKVVLNPGAVGMPLIGKSSSQFMILHGADHRWTEEFINISYDVEEVVEQLTQSGLADHAPYWCMITAALLRTNGNCSFGHAEVLQRAMELCRQENGVCNWPNIPETYWEQAVRELLPNL